MKNRSWIAWVVIALLFAAAIGYWLWLNNKKSVNWQEHYLSNSKDPYGTYLLKELIKFKYDNNVVDLTKSINEDLPEDDTQSSYIYIGQAFEITDNEQKALFEFVEKGNNAFIAAKYLPYSIQYLLKNGGTFTFDSISHNIIYNDSLQVTAVADTFEFEDEEEVTEVIESDEDSEENHDEVFEEFADEENTYEEYAYEDDSLNSNTVVAYDTLTISDTVYADPAFYQNGIKTSALFENKIRTSVLHPLPHAKKTYTFKIHESSSYSFIQKEKAYEWKGLSMQAALDSTCTGLTVLQDSLYNFIRIPYGKGFVYVCTSPILLTNYFVKEKDGLSHAEEILSVLSDKKIYWDEVPAYNRNSENDGNHHAKTTLRYILSNEALRWAWYLLLATVLVYITVESKRKQRITPVIEPINNTSIEYVQTTGRLYAQIGNHRKLIQLNMKLFLSTIQQKYGVKPDLDNPLSIEWLSVKTGISKGRFEELQKEYKRITVPGHEMKTKDLHTFYQLMQFIYKKIQN